MITKQTKVYIINSWDDIPYGDYTGIVKVFISKELAVTWVSNHLKDGSDYDITEEVVHYD